jgi:hypothetical protein
MQNALPPKADICSAPTDVRFGPIADVKTYSENSPFQILCRLAPLWACSHETPRHRVNGGVLPELTYRAALEQFGLHGAAELSYPVGLYGLVSVTLNSFDVPVPE